MRTVTYETVLLEAADVAGLADVAAISDLNIEEVSTLNRHANRWLRRAWEYFAWPELMRTEERYFRAPYDNAATYAIGDEVWYAAASAYYVATAATTGNLPTDTDYWEEATSLQRYVAYEQEDETALGEVLAVWNVDPRANRYAVQLPTRRSSRGVEIPPAVTTGNSVWVEYRLRPVQMNANTWLAASTYAAGQEVYFATDGRCYECLSATSAGESPSTAPAKWSEIEFPYIFQHVVAAGAARGLLKTDGQHAKARGENSDVAALLDEEVGKIVSQEGVRPQVHVGVRAAV
jgi:hypothetical protein